MTLRLILAGLGVRGRHWAEVITRAGRADIAAYVDPNPAMIARAAEQYGPRPSFATLDEALAALSGGGIGGLVLANPPIGREAQVRACAERGIPMLIEKPLALSVKEAARLVGIAEAAGVALMVGLNFRYLGVTQALQALFAGGTIGTPAFARFTYERWRDGNRPDLNKYPLTMDQPMLWEQSIHHFDLIRHVYGSDPVSVMAHTWNPPWSMYASDANVAALFALANGMIVNYQGTWQSGWQEPGFEWRTDCTGGVALQRHQFGELAFARKHDPSESPVPLPPHEQWITETSGLLEAFLNHVLDGAPLECSGRDHLASLAMVEACALSSRETRSVFLAEILDGAQADYEGRSL
jgi:predicted dehydrogenase